MVNAWSLLYDELYGEDGMSDEDMYDDFENPNPDQDLTISLGGIDYVSADFPTGNLYAADTVDFIGGMGTDMVDFNWGSGSSTANTAYYFGGSGLDDIVNINVGAGNTAYDDLKYYGTKPKPDLKSGSTQKYQEDKGIADLKDYVSSTYQGHYTNDNSDVQTLDLIHSVGDAESFCRSNAIKYLSRYDKKGQAKRDILKAMHYCLLLYYFSGNTNNETPTRGYETF